MSRIHDGARITGARQLTSRPTVSVVVPCYNYGRYLGQSVGSAMNQSGLDVEVLIIDDASTDGSADIARRISTECSDVRVIQHARNQGHISTYNDGLRAARGDYVVLLSADDALPADSLTRAVALMDEIPDVGLVYGPVVEFVRETPVRHVPPAESWVVWPGRTWAHRIAKGGINVIRSPEAIVRRSLLAKVGMYDPDHPHAGDLQMWLRIAAVADVGYLPGTVQAYYRQHEQSMHSAEFGTNQARGMMTELRHRYAAFSSASRSFDGEAILNEAREAIALEAIDLAARAYVWGLTSTWPVTELVDFARTLNPEIMSTRAGRAFSRRERVGIAFSRRNPMFVVRERLLDRNLLANGRSIAEWGVPL